MSQDSDIKVPWRFEQYREAHGETTDGKKFGWKLFHYLSGGGMKTFGRTVEQEARDIRQNRFLLVASIIGIIWLLLLIF